MKIDASTVQMLASHSAASSTSTQSKLKVWVGDRPTGQGESRRDRPLNVQSDLRGLGGASLRLSEAGLRAAQAPADTSATASASTTAVQDAEDPIDKDPKMQLIRFFVERMTGQSIRTLRSADLSANPPLAPAGKPAGPASTQASGATPTPQRAGFGVELDSHTVIQETEQTRFEAQAVVRTADGREIRMTLSLEMSRSYRAETSLSLRLGDAVKKDPLVINFSGNAAELQSQRFSFDLNGDGSAEDVALLSGNSGYLALDTNQNGRIDSGRELFGPATGQGFAELAAYDQDGNGWIDEGDAVFKQLKVWSPSADGAGQMNNLQGMGVGALYLGATRTPFELKDASNNSLGSVRSTGMYLMENGRSGTLQQIDLTV